MPISVKEAIGNIHARKYLLPAIQREVVWDTAQIERLLDSLAPDGQENAPLCDHVFQGNRCYGIDASGGQGAATRCPTNNSGRACARDIAVGSPPARPARPLAAASATSARAGFKGTCREKENFIAS